MLNGSTQDLANDQPRIKLIHAQQITVMKLIHAQKINPGSGPS
jgi:hypothetical protein